MYAVGIILTAICVISHLCFADSGGSTTENRIQAHLDHFDGFEVSAMTVKVRSLRGWKLAGKKGNDRYLVAGMFNVEMLLY